MPAAAAAAAAPNALAPTAPGVYGGGAAAGTADGGGAFLMGDVALDALEVERPRPDVPPTLRVLPLAAVVLLVARILAIMFSQGQS